jgi:hypothetical protein
VTGRCLCGAIRYEVEGEPLQVANCHCSMCRRHSGAAYLTYVAYLRNQVRFVGTPAEYRSSPNAVRTHCGQCGSPLSFVFDPQPHMIWITVGSLDDPGSVGPTEHWYTDDKVSWVSLHDDLPKFPAAAP